MNKNTRSQCTELQTRFAAIDLYPVTCEQLSEGRTDNEILDAVIAGGAKIIQLRDKTAPAADLLDKARHFRAMTRQHGLLLIVNDHVDLALEVGADGVHLGQGDTQLAEARGRMPEGLIGISTHSVDQAVAAQDGGADYVNIGPIFETGTKDVSGAVLGPAAIRDIVPHLSVPFTVMGGIHHANLDIVLDAGARRVAVVTAITRASDPAAAVAELRARILARD